MCIAVLLAKALTYIRDFVIFKWVQYVQTVRCIYNKTLWNSNLSSLKLWTVQVQIFHMFQMHCGVRRYNDPCEQFECYEKLPNDVKMFVTTPFWNKVVWTVKALERFLSILKSGQTASADFASICRNMIHLFQQCVEQYCNNIFQPMVVHHIVISDNVFIIHDNNIVLHNMVNLANNK